MYIRTLHGNIVNTQYIVSVNIKERAEDYFVEVETVIGNKRKVFAGMKEECEKFVDELSK